MLKELFKKGIDGIQEKIYDYKTIRPEPSVWIEENIYLTKAESNFTGFFRFDRTPYTREIVDNFSPNSAVEIFGIMKCSQSGLTAAITGVIAYMISQSPCNMMFLSGSESLVQDTIRDRLDPIIQNSGISHLIRPNVFKKKNQKSGDTDFKKEYAGGSLTAVTYNPRHLRFYSAKVILADEFDDAPRNDKKEGSVRSLVEARTKSFGSSKKIGYISSPTTKGMSNIEEVFDLGDQRKWNWCCPHCKTYIPMEWRIEKEDGTYAGIKYELNEQNELIEDSVHYECQNCSGKITHDQKYVLNLSGKWIPTVKPKKPQYRSYQLNALVIPPGFDSWTDLVYQWLEACPPNEYVDEGKLKTFVNVQLGQTWEEKGKTVKIHDLMNNVRSYNIGEVPDVTCEKDGNGKIVLITMACDLGGVMEIDNEDVRIDWEIVAHSSTGVTYHINHGSIGTFKRSRKKSKKEKENESEREQLTYSHGQRLSVWPRLKKIIDEVLIGQSGEGYDIDITVIDTGHFTKLTYDFIKGIEDTFVIGIKGYGEEDYRKLSKDTPVISRSREQVGKLYLLQVNQLKDILAENIKLRMGLDGFQPSGMMNFPQPSEGKYNLTSYFNHYEAEHRVAQMKGDQVTGFAWKKKNSSLENHFFDVSVYNIAAREIYIDLLRRSNSKYSKLDWDTFVSMMA